VGIYQLKSPKSFLVMVNLDQISAAQSDPAIIRQIGHFIKHSRAQKNLTQAELAKRAGLNRYTLSKIETGESITLASLIQILRALDALSVLDQFVVQDEISPLAYAKLKRKTVQRVQSKKPPYSDTKQDDLEW
jgi:transcriptional regulator with XRE-family HTH domain